MAVTPLATEVYTTAQQSPRTAGPLNMVILHHAATTSFDQVVNMMVTGSKQVSAHAVVKDNRVGGVVDETNRAWSLSDAYWDSRAFTVECANESTDGWTISAESHETLAQLTANWASRYGFPIIRTGDPTTWTLLGHREVYSIYGDSYSTACPGGMDLDWIAARANEILNGDEDDEMKALIWYAESNSADGTIKAGDYWALGSVYDAAYQKVNLYTAQDMKLMGGNVQTNSGDNIAVYVASHQALPPIPAPQIPVTVVINQDDYTGIATPEGNGTYRVELNTVR